MCVYHWCLRWFVRTVYVCASLGLEMVCEDSVHVCITGA